MEPKRTVEAIVALLQTALGRGSSIRVRSYLPGGVMRHRWLFQAFQFALLACLPWATAWAQDASTGAIRGMVEDLSGARVAGAQVVARNEANGIERRTITDGRGAFAAQLLEPGEYTVRVASPGLQTELQNGIRVDVGAATEVQFQLRVAENKETVTVTGETRAVEAQADGVSALIDAHAIADLPLGGRRFTDLALLTPGVTQDPRGLTSGSNGDLSFGGIRGFQTSFLVDGTDNNNAFFSQARGRYRAPYQFSNEVVHEFRIASNSYGAEHGRAGGAVVNVVTKSGGNHLHGTGFYYLRDSAFNAHPAGVNFKPNDRQHQGGFTLGGPLRKNRIFFFSGFDQHVFRVPTLVRFDNGSSVAIPQKGQEPLFHGDYEDSDKDLVFAQAAQLSNLGGNYQSQLLGNTGFLKVDFALNSKNYLTARLNTSRYWGTNNVFFDPASPITNFSMSENGEETVGTETAALSLNSAFSARLTNHLRAQLSRDLQSSRSNSTDVRTRIPGVIEGFGRSTILPRRTNEERLHLAETLNFEAGRSSWKLGGDALLTRIDNFFPSLSGGEYIFNRIKVKSVHVRAAGGRTGVDPPTRLRAQRAALLHSELRQGDFASRHQRVFGICARYGATERQFQPEPGCALRLANLPRKRAGVESALAASRPAAARRQQSCAACGLLVVSGR